MAMDHGRITFKRYQINTLVALLSTPVAGKVARSRNRFITLIAPLSKEADAERKEKLDVFIKRDAEGNKLFTQETKDLPENEKQYELTNKEAWAKQWEELQQKTFSIACVGESLVDFNAVFAMLDNFSEPLDVATTTVYDGIMTAFEDWKKSQQQ